MSNVKVSNLGISFGANAVIKGMNLEAIEGEFLVLLGPSGCGKSTLLHSIAGLIEPEHIAEGSIEIGGKDVTQSDPSERGIGMVFQSYALYPTMTVERNMSFGLRVSGMKRDEIERRVQRVAQMLQLDLLLKRKPAQLSGGQRQRVAIGRALVREADVFLFDEPLSNLDAKLRTELRRELKLLHQTLGSTMIYVTHDQVEAMTLASRIVVMRHGVVQQIGAPGEVYERPQNLFVAGFLGAPAMNFMPGVIHQAGAGMELRAGPLTLSLADYPFAERPHELQAVTVGLRPEHLLLRDDGAFEARVKLIEPMGNHQVLWLEAGSQQLAALDHASRTLAVGQTLRFDVDAARLSLFDQGSEQRL